MDKITLPSGMRLLLEEMPQAYSCTMHLCVGAGLRYEDPAQPGLSHMMEHMLFKGTARRRARELAEGADDLGASVNAYTTKEYTSLFMRSLPEHTAAMMDLMGDMVCHCKLAEEDLTPEKGVVLEEFAMYEDSPEDLAFDLFYDTVWPDHLMGKNILGTRESIAAMTQENLRRYWARFYRPERMVLAVCGKFDPAEIRRLCESHFSDFPDPPPPESEVSPGECPANYCRTVRMEPKNVEQNQLILGFPGYAGADERRYRAALLSTMLGGASSSRLFQRLREELGLVYSIDFFNVHHLREGVSGVELGLSEKMQVRALEEVLRILREFPDTVTPTELRRAQEQAAAGLVMSMESASARASRNAAAELLFGQTRTMEESIAAYRAVTLEEIRVFAREMLRPDQFSLFMLGKGGHKTEKALRSMINA
ncbi:MAG: insulinase family protein [Oscillospiraceae bacterium]|jgi:predicted Zn-dependent peptidase|nr:insulinase family protein [Oscillospiraceae bacterium]